MVGLKGEVVQRGMLERSVDPTRYRGVVREDKTVRWALAELGKVERLRGRSPDAWPSPAALPEALGRLAELLVELGWDDLAALARREELSKYRELDAARPGAFSGVIHHVLGALRSNLVDLERYEEALECVDEQLRLPGQSAEVVAGVREWRTLILDWLGRNEEAVEAAAVAVSEVRGRLGGAPVDLELSHALAAYADQLDRVGRVAESAEATAEVVAYWRGRSDATVQFLHTVDLLSDRLVRSGRTEEAGAHITEAMRKVRRRESHPELADTWCNLSDRLLSLGLWDQALVAGEEAVRFYRESMSAAREHHRQVEAEDWDDDHRYTEWYLRDRWSRRVESSQKRLREAEQDLRDGLLNLGACLRRLDRIDEAAAADAEAAEIT